MSDYNSDYNTDYQTREVYAEGEPAYEPEYDDYAEGYDEGYEPEVQFNPIDRPKKVRRKKNYFVRFLIFVGVLIVLFVFSFSDFFMVKKFVAEGNSYYSDEEILNMAGAQLGVNLIWDVDLSEMEEALSDNPYFVEVKAKRKLPNTLCVEVNERKQIAAIVYGEKYIVIDKEGTVLRKTTVDPKITLLTGLTISKLSVGQTVEAEEDATLESTLAMLNTMEEGDIFFKKIDVSKVVIKAYIYDTLVVKGTPKQMTKAIESGDLQKVVNNLLKNDTVRGTISLGNHNYMSFSPEF